MPESSRESDRRLMAPRILFVVNHAGFFLSHRLPLAQAAKDAGYDVHIATPASKHVPAIIASGLPWHPIQLSRSGSNPLRELRTFRDLLHLYRTLRPHLVHHVTSKPVVYGTIAARLTRVPAVVNAISGTGHAFVDGGVMRNAARSIVGIGYRLSQRHHRMRVIFQNREQFNEFIARRWVLARDGVLIPGSGVNLEVFRPIDRNRRVPVVALAGRMLFSKGVAEFVEAARLLRTRGVMARFLLVGEPDPENPGSIAKETLQQWASDGAVEYLGRVEDMPAAFAGIDIFCLPTYYGEGVPKVLVEAAACGIPAVTTDWPGCRDVVENEQTGILVPVRNVERLADALQRLVEDGDLRRQMGIRARERATRFSLPIVVEKTLAVYRELIG